MWRKQPRVLLYLLSFRRIRKTCLNIEVTRHTWHWVSKQSLAPSLGAAAFPALQSPAMASPLFPSRSSRHLFWTFLAPCYYLNSSTSIHSGLCASMQIYWAHTCWNVPLHPPPQPTAWEIGLKGPYYLTYPLKTHSSLTFKKDILLQVPVRPYLFPIPNAKFGWKCINVV